MFQSRRLRQLTSTHAPVLIQTDPDDPAVVIVDPTISLQPGDLVELQSDEPAPLLAARLLTKTPRNKPLPPTELRLATTRGTNALLERAGAPTAFVTTEGFADLLRIGTQQRPDLFALDIQRPPPLHDATIEVRERVGANGDVLVTPDEQDLAEQARAVLASGIRSAAVVLMHADRFPAHEQRVATILRDLGFEHVVQSHKTSKRLGLLQRAQTTLIDAYLAPIVRSYLDDIESGIGANRVRVLSSAGSLIGIEYFRPKDGLLSGPAGGVVGARNAASDEPNIITFDMGGTSTDVSRCDGALSYTFTHTVGDASVGAPAVRVETVAAGGGSICSSGHDGLQVGPASAGARPGPACYGDGGPLTITDVNLLLGRLPNDTLRVPLRADHAEARLDEELVRARHFIDPTISREALLDAFLELANEKMAHAIRSVSTRDGVNPTNYAMVAFGGAGPMHACAVASRLAISRVIIPPAAGLLSAEGLAAARVEAVVERQTLMPLDTSSRELNATLAELERESEAQLVEDGIAADDARVVRRIASVRQPGHDHAIDLDINDIQDIENAYESRFRQIFGYDATATHLEVVALRVVGAGPEACQNRCRIPPPTATGPTQTSGWFAGQRTRVAILRRGDVDTQRPTIGPAIIADDDCTTIVERGWTAQRELDGAITLLKQHDDTIEYHAPESVEVELLSNGLMAIAEEMGEALRRTSISTNVKDRLDFSCAVLDAQGRLLANAPHVPVHLGSLGVCVRSVRDHIELEAGDVVATNHPAMGGSHLPDITVIAPIHDDDGRLVAHAAARAHHAEVGGATPGSFPTDASNLQQEGVVLPPIHVVKGGVESLDEFIERMRTAPYPTRAIDDNVADLRGAIAATHAAVAAIKELARSAGADTLASRSHAIYARAANATRRALAQLSDGANTAEEHLENGARLRVRVQIDADRATIDFTGTSPTDPTNFNATPAIVQSAVMYVLRLLLDEPLPLNDGLLDPIDIVLPEETLLNPTFNSDPTRCPAVVGGNVETSQRLVDTLLKAFKTCACSQGTMNNLVIGNDDFSYYETICGGAGAGDGFHGADAVHTHMTNTRITDPEVLEHRYPVRLDRFTIRRGSGGSGAFSGGNGAIRELTMLKDVRVSMLTQHRTIQPYGLDGGAPGATGHQRHVRNGTTTMLPHATSFDADAGDRIIIETPGGGGYGSA